MRIEVLDYGYVELVEVWGHGLDATHDAVNDPERRIIEAARQSTQGAFRGWEAAACTCPPKTETNASHASGCPSIQSPGDERLLEYLYNNDHATPFEFAGMVIEVHAPIFVFREWHRHRTQSFNEMSGRYAPLPDVNYIPSIERLTMNNINSNKQAGKIKGASELTEEHAETFQYILRDSYELAQGRYEQALTQGVPKELARCLLPVGRYSKMRAHANLRNWLAFMTLRCAPNAQWEIQEYAWAVANIIEEKFPHTYKLWFSRKMWRR